MPNVPGWLPNWRDANQYPNSDIMPGRRLAWEFLRRNPRYQELWERLVAPCFDETTGLFRFADDFENCGTRLVQFGNPFTEFREIFGIIGFHPPSEQSVSLKFVRDGIIEQRGTSPVERPQNEILIKVNLAEHTHDSAQRLLTYIDQRAQHRRVKPPKTSNHKSKFPTYLRALDAKCHGVSLSEIGDRLFSHIRNDYPERARENAARYALKAATKLRDAGYRWID